MKTRKIPATASSEGLESLIAEAREKLRATPLTEDMRGMTWEEYTNLILVRPTPPGLLTLAELADLLVDCASIPLPEGFDGLADAYVASWEAGQRDRRQREAR